MTYRGGSRRNPTLLSLFDQSKIQAIVKGEIHTVKQLILSGADVNVKDVKNRSYLHLACYMGASEIVKILIGAGAKVNCKDSEGLAPIHRACRNNHERTLEILLQQRDIDVNVKNKTPCDNNKP